MATQTTNLGLTKPGYDEAADVVPAVNNNMDTLDQKIGAVPANSSVQGQLDSHTQAIATLNDHIANKFKLNLLTYTTASIPANSAKLYVITFSESIDINDSILLIETAAEAILANCYINNGTQGFLTVRNFSSTARTTITHVKLYTNKTITMTIAESE